MDPKRQTPTEPEKEHYTYDEMMARLRGQRSGGGGQRVKIASPDGSIEVRKRKRRSHQPAKERQRITGKLKRNVLLVTLAVILVLIGAYLLVNVRYQSDSYRSSLSSQATGFIGASTELSPLNIKGLSVRSRRMFIEPEDGALLQDAEFISLHGRLTYGSLLSSDWNLTSLNALHGKLNFRAPTKSFAGRDRSAAGSPLTGAGLGFSSKPTAFNIQNARVGSTDFVWANGLKETIFVEGATLSSQQIGPETEMLIVDAKLRFGEWPEFDLETAEVSFSKDEIRVKDALLHHELLGNSAGDAMLSGVVDMSGASPVADFVCELTEIPAKSLVQEAWLGKIEGEVDTTLRFKADLADPGSLQVSGPFWIRDGNFGDLTPTKRLAVFLAEPRISRINFHSIKGVITIDKDARSVDELEAHAAGLLKIRGSYKIKDDGVLSGSLDLSISNEILDKLPCGRPDFFTPVEGDSGMSSTRVELGGTSSEPTEDLTTRLSVALEKHEIDSAAPPASAYPTIPLAPDAVRPKQKSPGE
ncbi:MAG: hypothetical protein ACR2RV_13130 [Verrucomicrobiales bacterium]